MFLRFLWLIIHFAEWVFGVVHCFADHFQRFGHTMISFVEVSPCVKDANGLVPPAQPLPDLLED